MGMGGPHSLLAMCVSVGRQAFNHIWYRGRARQENQHVVNFQTTEGDLVAIHSSLGEDIVWDMKNPKFQNNAAQRTLREKKEPIF